MNAKLVLLPAVIIVVCLTGCCSTTQARWPSSTQTVTCQADKAGLLRLGKAQFERGDLESATQTLLDVLRADPQNRPALYYLDLVREAELKQSLNKRDRGSRFWYPTIPPRRVG